MPGSDELQKTTRRDSGTLQVMVRVANLSKSYGALTAVDNVSFELEKGQVLGFLGSDGAGKTTLLRMIAAMLRPSSGNILIAGLDAVARKKRIKNLIGYMPQRFGLYQDLSVEENIDFFMDIYGITGSERVRRKKRYLGFSNLLPFLDRMAGALSGGMKQKLGLACVLIHQPDVLILDEPTNGVDPVSRREFWDILAQMRDRGMTILVSTAYMDEGDKCDRLLLMHAGRVLATGRPEVLRGDYPDLEQAVVAHLQAAEPELREDGFVA